METPSFKEDHISQIPALQVLQNLRYNYISPEKIFKLRGEKNTNVILDSILRERLKKINKIHISSTKTAEFTDTNIDSAIHALKNPPMQEGYITASEYIYNLLTLGKSFEQSIEGDKKSFTIKYIDWETPENNYFHITEEYRVTRSHSQDYYTPDIVLFVNGIPLGIIECKRPDMKEPIKQAISQHLRNQQEDGIRNLYVYAQLLLSIATEHAAFGTNSTPPKFWAQWTEKFETRKEEQEYLAKLDKIRNQPLTSEQKDELFSGRFRYVRDYFDQLGTSAIIPTKQDTYLLSLCEPKRFLELIFSYILFDEGEKKIARYQQYFAIRKTAKRIHTIENSRRKGGVIWHTQGSGKSLTMVMLAQAIALDESILTPKIVLVTDRVDLDDQITKTFHKCGKFVENATTGKRLVELLESKTDAVVTTIINKFEAAVNKIQAPLESKDIFVLVDEGHRSQHGSFNITMQKALPNACFIAFTGTPLFKKDKSTALKFGGIIDTYTVDEAVNDKAVVPLLYEGRHAIQNVNDSPIDKYFKYITEPFSEYKKAEFKKKFSRADQLNVADQKILAICWDISRHYRDNWQGTPFKAQLVCPNKDAAIRYKNYLDEIGLVSSEVLISPPDDREGEDSAYVGTSDKVKAYWKGCMDEHGNPTKYEKNVINRFKKHEHPEIIIVVDKLLTGFDEPKNTVLYLTRNLKGHKLLQAIARVNRIFPDKEFGYIIDYYGVIEELDKSLILYSSFEEFDEADLEGVLQNITEEIDKLPQKHSELWDIFKTVENKRDAEAYTQVLNDPAVRVIFYEKLASFAKSLKVALSSIDFHRNTGEKTIGRYKEDLKMFMSLRVNAIQVFSDAVDYKQYEGQIQKLIDTHIQTDEILSITELVNIFNKEEFQKEVEKTTGTAAKAHKIASRTSKHIAEKMDEDPAFYKKFSDMLKDTIREYEERRITEAQFLKRTNDIMDKVLSKTDNDLPEELKEKPVARAFYGLSEDFFKQKIQDEVIRKEISKSSALHIDDLIKASVLENENPIVDWPNKKNITGMLTIDIGDYLIDEVRDKYNVSLSFGEMDNLAERCIDVAKIRYKG